MREAAIETRRNAPRLRATTPRAKSRSHRWLAASLLPIYRLLRRHPGKAFAVTGCAVLAGSIIGNAVLFQSGRHPAPLFGRAAPVHPASEPTVGAVPLPAPRPLAIARPVEPSVVTAPAAIAAPQVAAASKTPHASPPPHRTDTIAQLLRGDDKAPNADSRLTTAQRALTRLGFAVRADGRMNPSTRQALDAFSRSHHLAPGADLSPKLMRELAAATAALPKG